MGGRVMKTMKMLFKVAVVLFAAEFAVMCMLPLLGLDGIWEAAADSLLLTIIALPALYGLGFRAHRVIDARELRQGTRLERKMLFLLGANVLLVMLVVVVYGLVATKLESGSRVINVAGRQRMLSRWLAQAAMFESMELAHAEMAGREPGTSGVIANCSSQFERALRGLTDGDPELGLPSCPSNEAILQLKSVGEAWQPLLALVQQTSEPSDMDEASVYYTALNEAADRVVAEMEEAVSILDDHYTAQGRLLSRTLGLTIVAAAVIALTLVVTVQQVMRHRKRLEESLRQSEARIRAIVESAADGIITIDERGTIESFNNAAENLFGYAAGDVIGKNVSMLMPSPHREEHDGHVQRYLDTGEKKIIGSTREVPARRKDGSTFPVELHVSEVRIGDRRLFTGIARDITERKQAEKALQESEMQLSVAFENTPGIMILVDEERRVRRVNRDALDLTGPLADGMIGLRHGDAIRCIHSLDDPKGCGFGPFCGTCSIRSAVLDTLETGRGRQPTECQLMLSQEGEPKETHIILSTIPLDLPTGRMVLLCIEDITEGKRASRELHGALQAAEAASTVKSDFLANMSHEIRTPMTAILGFTENLLDPELSDSEKLNAIHIIRGNGEHLLQIINDILDISRIEAGKLEVEQIRYSPVQIIADVQSLMQVRADDKELSFAVEYIGAIPEMIRSDPTRFKQILVNLIGNAIKFTDDGGVRLVTRFGGSGPDEPMLQLDVIDSGIGMTEEQVARLFQAFTQANASTTRKFGGTGLGLTISKRLANLLGGDISVTSKPAEGSTFRVTVATGPLDGVKMLDNPARAKIVKPEDTGGAKPDEAKLDCRILLAEDGPDNQRLISHVLKKAGADVTVVENGSLAADAALAARDEGNAFHVILMDMQMPVMDGYQATGLLRQKGYVGPIIALTAHAMASDRQKCIEAGCDDYASKPIDRKKLIKMIQEHRHKWPLSEKGGVPATDARKAPEVLLSALADDPDMADLVQAFVAELPDRLAAIEKTLSEDDLDALGRLAHQLKGSAGSYGFPTITEAAEGLEASAKTREDLNKLRVDVRKLVDLCRRVRASAPTG